MNRQPPAAALAAVSLFVAVDLAAFVAFGSLARALDFPFFQWIALLGVLSATAVCIHVMDAGRWDLGLFVDPRLAGADLLRGGVTAAAIIAVADGLVLVSSGTRHEPGSGFPWFEIAMVFIPAALHEELAFRGYVYQKLRQWNRDAAIFITAASFALLHLGNPAISPVGVINIMLAGVLLALGYERRCRLWFPIGIHFAWNLVSGPVLGYGVSGYAAHATLLRTVSRGPAWLTGGAFGIEGSIWMGLAELGGIWWMQRPLTTSERT